MHIRDITGQRFGALTALRKTGSKNRKAMWLCRCECGREIEAKGQVLLRGKRLFCDWRTHREACKPRLGRVKDLTLPQHACRLTWISWQGMWSRCTYECNVGWKNYGGRGIAVCDRWRDFMAFLADMGERPSSKFSIERVDVNGNYEPSNCIWATAVVQAANRRSSIGRPYSDRTGIAMERLACGETTSTLRRAGFRNTEIIRAKHYLEASHGRE